MRRRAGLVALLLATLAGPVLPTAPAHAGAVPGQIGVRLEPLDGRSPADARSRFYLVAHLRPGTSLTRVVTVMNTTPVRQHVELYPAAATVDGDAFRFAPDRTANDLTTWTTVTPSTVDMVPGATTAVEVTVRVPADAPRGERYAVAWAAVHSAPTPGGSVQQVNRVGVRMYVDIGAGGEPRSDFTIGAAGATRTPDGAPVVSATVVNTGERALDLAGTIALTDGPGGLTSAPARIRQGLTLAPGAHGQVSAVLDPSLPGGAWTARITLESGTVRHEASSPVTVPAFTLARYAAATGTGTVVAWSVGAVGFALGVALTLFLRARRRPGPQ